MHHGGAGGEDIEAVVLDNLVRELRVFALPVIGEGYPLRMPHDLVGVRKHLVCGDVEAIGRIVHYLSHSPPFKERLFARCGQRGGSDL